MSDKRWRILSWVLLAGVAGMAIATVGDYGVVWDEEYYKEYGVVLLNWYSSLGADQEALSKWRLNDYGGFFDIAAHLVVQISPLGVYETRHVVNMVFGLLGIAATYGLGHQLAGAKGGFLAALFLALTPRYYGEMFNNSKDIPFAALSALSLFCLLRSISLLPTPPRRAVLQLGIATGLAMAIRVAWVVLLGYVALVWIGWLVGRYWTRSIPAGGLLRVARGLAARFLAVTVIAWTTMVAFWPYAQVSPILNPLRALRDTLNYDWPLTVFFHGRFIKASQLPADYLPTWFAISLPEFYFVSLLAACILAAFFIVRLARRDGHVDALLRAGLLVVFVSVPILTHVVLRSTIYDGMRQLIFVVPALAALAGASVAGFLGSQAPALSRVAAIGAVVVSAGLTVTDMVELHPYQYVYFNRMVAGGLESASTHFETDYYGASYREGVRWLRHHYPSQGRERVRVANPSRNFLTAYYIEQEQELQQRFKPVEQWDKPHIYMSITRWEHHKEKKGRILHVVSRKGVPLLYVIELQHPNQEDT